MAAARPLSKSPGREGYVLEEQVGHLLRRAHQRATQELRGVEQWAAALGCAALASDATADNLESRAFHVAMGFTVVDQVPGDSTYFCKSLT